jgi:hypothetical protein
MNSLDPKPNSDLLSANEMTAKSKKDEEDWKIDPSCKFF